MTPIPTPSQDLICGVLIFVDDSPTIPTHSQDLIYGVLICVDDPPFLLIART